MGLFSRLFGDKKTAAAPPAPARAATPSTTAPTASPAHRPDPGNLAPRSTNDMDTTTKDRLDKLVHDNRVLLFMKGDRIFPQCGFSAATVEILKSYGVPFETVDVLSDPAIRQGIKEFSNWPTIPQLYIGGEFQGGCDIVREMHANGELKKLLADDAAAS